jgi:hypothetical protein
MNVTKRNNALRIVGKEVAGLTTDCLDQVHQFIRDLEDVRWNELTQEEKLDNLEDLSRALLFQRLIETGRFDMFHALVAAVKAIDAGEKSLKEDETVDIFDDILDFDGYIQHIAELPRGPNDVGIASSAGLTLPKRNHDDPDKSP